MPEVELIIGGISRLVWVQSLSEDSWQKELHQYRREGVLLRRRYYERTQFEAENLVQKDITFAGCTELEKSQKRLPEHLRKHSYAVQIEDGVDFLADQIAGKVQFVSDNEALRLWIEALFSLSRVRHRLQEVVQDMLVAGDVFARVQPVWTFDPGEPAVRIEFWQAEDVEVDYDEDDWTRMTEVRYERFRHEETGPDGELSEVRYVHVFKMAPQPTDSGEMVEEATEFVYRGDLDTLVLTRRLGLPFLPWSHLTGEKHELRSMWGKPVITTSLMETADRYSAVCQLEFLAMRYNAFAHLAVVGDHAHLALKDAGVTLAGDVADVFTFPGGTDLTSISLPTDTALISSQKETLIDAMFEQMGLQRIDPKTLTSMGQVSGYALEIVNRKTDGTFDRVVENLEEGLLTLIDLCLDIDAYTREATRVDVTGTEGLTEPVVAWWNTDPKVVWPVRDIDIVFGDAYIVDDVATRDDFVANLISRPEALRKRGYSDEEISRIEQELAEAADETEARMSTSLSQGSQLGMGRP